MIDQAHRDYDGNGHGYVDYYDDDAGDEDHTYSHENDRNRIRSIAPLLEDRYENIQQTLVCIGIGCYLNVILTLALLL